MKKNSIFKYYKPILFISALVLLFGYDYLEARKLFNDLSFNATFTIGTTTGFNYAGQSGCYLNYKYCIDGIYYEDDRNCNGLPLDQRTHSNFLLIYSKKNPTNNMLLLKYSYEDELCEIINSSIQPSFWDFYRKTTRDPSSRLDVAH